MTRIALVGPGAIGSVMAAWLCDTGRYDITLCARQPLGELRVDTPRGLLRVRAPVLSDPKQAEPVDWVLVATKAYDVAGAAA
jgi:2-dehydropantoate 2-reductase